MPGEQTGQSVNAGNPPTVNKGDDEGIVVPQGGIAGTDDDPFARPGTAIAGTADPNVDFMFGNDGPGVEELCNKVGPTNSNPNLGWYFDIREYEVRAVAGSISYQGNFIQQLSIGLDFREGEELTINEFVDRIQCKFFFAYQIGLTDRLYQIRAHFLPMGGPNTEAMLNVPVPAMGDTASITELTVQYSIFCNAAKGEFSIDFVTGPHGHHPGGDPDTVSGVVIPWTTALPVAIETPFFHKTAMILDKPPMPPEVNIVPFKETNNRALILLNTGAGSLDLKPEIIDPATDVEQFKQQYVAQGMLTTSLDSISSDTILEMVNTTEITFRMDDSSTTYEIYRTTAPPTAYTDFAGQKRADVMETYMSEHYAAPASFVDTLTPNVTYYYCFRVYDQHGHVSNPTTVFEVQLVDNNGQIFMIYKPYYFPTDIQHQYVRQCRRYLYVAPNWPQTYFDQAAFAPTVAVVAGSDLGSQPPENNILGVSTLNDKVWDKVFKIRLSSKKTGKKLDLNLTFKNTGVQNP
jgi:hypothetical protein